MTEVQGYIKDKKTKEPLVGASVVLEDMYQGDMVAGTITDSTGYFALEKRPGTVAKITYPGYRMAFPIIYTGNPRDYYLVKNESNAPAPINDAEAAIRDELGVKGVINADSNKTIFFIIVVIAIYILTNK